MTDIPSPTDGDVRVQTSTSGQFYIEEYRLDAGDWAPRPPGWFRPVAHVVERWKLDPRTAGYFANREDAEAAALALQEARTQRRREQKP